MQIFQLVYSRNIIHLMHLPKCVFHDVIGVSDRMDNRGCRGIPPVKLDIDRDWTGDEDRITAKGHHSKMSIALAQTCHQIYSETIPLIYNSNVFSMHSPLTLVYLHDYILLPQRFFGIRHLHLRWDRLMDWSTESRVQYPPHDRETWVRFWALVARLELLSLTLYMEIWEPSRPYGRETEFIRPLLKITGARQAGVQLVYHENPIAASPVRLPQLERQVIERWTSPRDPSN